MRDDPEGRLIPLSNSENYSIRAGDPDVRGWKVTTGGRRVVGVVDDLVLDRTERRIRYLRVRTSRHNDDGERESFILIPVGIAILHPELDEISVPQVMVSSIQGVETTNGGLLVREYEIAIRRGILAAVPEAAGDLDSDADDFYGHDVYDENRFYRPRRERTDEREFLENLAVTGVSEDDNAPEVVGEVRAGNVDIPIVEDRE